MRGYCAVALAHGKLKIPQHSYRNPAAMEAMYATDNNYYPITLDLLRVPCNYNNDHHYKIRPSNQNAARYARPSWIDADSSGELARGHVQFGFHRLSCTGACLLSIYIGASENGGAPIKNLKQTPKHCLAYSCETESLQQHAFSHKAFLCGHMTIP